MSSTQLDTKTEIIQTLDRLSDEALQQVLECARSLSPPSSHDERVWQAYLESEREREEVYRRLADS